MSEITATIVRILGVKPENIDVQKDHTIVSVSGMYERLVVGYDQLLELTRALGTTSVDFKYNAGWGGTDVTPGDAPEYCILIGVGHG